MKNNKPVVALLSIISIIFLMHLMAGTAIASEAPGNWRPTYDLVMKWINFFILVFIIVKYGKAPLTNFLNGKKNEIAQEIKIIEEQKKIAEEKSKETLSLIKEGEEHIAKIKQKITEQGERKKQDIIESARKQSELMIEKAKKKIEQRILTEKEKIRSELVDSAINIAMEKLPGEMTDEDNKKFIDYYLSHEFS